MDYVDIDLLHTYGTFIDPSEETDALLEVLISAASEAIDNHCHRTFAVTDASARTFTVDNELLSSIPSRVLWLPEDLCTVPTIAGDPTVTLIPASPPYNRIVLDVEEGYWQDPTVITGKWAYSETPPATIVQVCLRLTKWLYDMRESGRGEMVMIDGVVVLPPSLPADIVLLLTDYVKVLLP